MVKIYVELNNVYNYQNLINYINTNECNKIFFYNHERDTLMYIDILKKIIDNIHEPYNKTFFIYTNGKLLTQEIIDYFNANNMFIVVYYSGINSGQIHKINILDLHYNLLLNIKRLGFYAKFTNKSYIDDIINSPLQQFFIDYINKNYTLDLFIDYEFDTINCVDINIFIEQLKLLLNKYINKNLNLIVENKIFENFLKMFVDYIYTTSIDTRLLFNNNNIIPIVGKCNKCEYHNICNISLIDINNSVCKLIDNIIKTLNDKKEQLLSRQF